MNLVVNIEFYLSGPLVSNRVVDINSVKTILKTLDLTEPRPVKLTCYADIINTDKTDEKNDKSFSFITQPNGKEVDSLGFTVASKISTVADIRSELNKKYGQTFNFNPKIGTEDKPAMLDHILTRSGVGLRDSKTGRPTQWAYRSVSWHYLNDNDKIVSRDLEQIWPIGPNTILTAIQDFFKVNVR